MGTQKFSSGSSLNKLSEDIGYSIEELVNLTSNVQGHEYMKPLDYIILALFFFISLIIGVALGFDWKKICGKSDVETSKNEEGDLLKGKRNLSAYPVAMSLTAACMSAITVLGTPKEIYTNGTMYYWNAVTYLLVAIVVAQIFLPVLYPLEELSNGYEYFKYRFKNSLIEKIACFTFR